MADHNATDGVGTSAGQNGNEADNGQSGENPLLEAALGYAALKWRCVPLHAPVASGGCSCGRAGCEAAGKHPRVREWQRAATTDPATITGWWGRWPAANVGVALGPDSGIIDIETDSPEEEVELVQLFGGDPPPTCCFTAGRGKHWLFRWQADLPGGAVCHFGHLGIRTGNGDKGAQSVMPPSLHRTGKRYTWLVSPADCHPAALPADAVARLWNLGGQGALDFGRGAGGNGEGSFEPKPREHWERILGGVGQGSRNESMASYIGRLLRGAGSIDDQATVEVLWQTVCMANERHKPPLPEKELRGVWLSIIQAEQRRRSTEEIAQIAMLGPEARIASASGAGGNGEKPSQCAEMRLVIVESDPPRYKLFAPQFEKADGGYVSLTAEQMLSARAIEVEALRQARFPMPKAFGKAWRRDGGLYERLVLHATTEAAGPENQRQAVVADRLLDELAKAKDLEEGEPIPKRGRAYRLPNGDIVFSFRAIWEELKFGADQISRQELSNIVGKAGAGWAGLRKTLKLVTPEAMRNLEILAEGLTSGAE